MSPKGSASTRMKRKSRIEGEARFLSVVFWARCQKKLTIVVSFLQQSSYVKENRFSRSSYPFYPYSLVGESISLVDSRKMVPNIPWSFQDHHLIMKYASYS